MRRLTLVSLCAATVVAIPLCAQKKQTTSPAKPPVAARKGKPQSCYLDLINSNTWSSEDHGGGVTTILGGDVRLACVDRDVTLASDSMIAANGYDVVTAINHVKYHDEKYDILADTLRRFVEDTLKRPKVGERILLSGNVKVTDRKTGSTLVGPIVNYYRAAPGTADSDQVIALNRPTATLRPEQTGKEKTPPSPWIVTADLLKGWGTDKINAYGTATVQHDSLHASGDSLTYLNGKTKSARIFGPPAKMERTGKDSIRIQGKELLLAFDENDKLKRIHSRGNGVLFSAGATTTADTLQLGLKGDVLTSIEGWDHAKRAHLQREGYDAFADSLAIDSKDSHISELRLFVKGMVYQPIDSSTAVKSKDSLAVPDRDWLSGQRVVVTFRQTDSLGSMLTMVDRLVANRGPTKVPSCSFFSESADSTATNTTKQPTINYACADAITVRMKTGISREVEDVALRGNVNGLQLEHSSTTAAAPKVPPVKKP